jgi:hypothetical protein
MNGVFYYDFLIKTLLVIYCPARLCVVVVCIGSRVPRSRDRGEAYTREREANGSVVSVQVALGMASSCSGTMDSPLTNTCCVHSEPHNVLASRRNGGVVVAVLSAEEWRRHGGGDVMRGGCKCTLHFSKILL